MLGSVAFNYSAGYWIGLQRTANSNIQAKYSLTAAIIANLTLLGYFKYTNFCIGSVNQFFGSNIPALDIILPLGISFFTFTQIAFLVDVYRGIARKYNFIHYLLFVTYFPHLIAGPVLHHKQMMPQFANPATYRINAGHISIGLTIFVLGLSKKVLIADNLSEYATPIFNAARDGHVLMLFEAWVGALAYTLQLYFDFSGYSDMAIGLSLMFNVRLPLNFDSPYKASNIIDFWRRWHMTLSAFLRDYLYIPLGGNRKGTVRRYLNLLATMLLGGLWHGAGWTFIVWGGLHGLYLIINHSWRELKSRLGWNSGGHITKLIAGAITFLSVVVAWVFFRADSFNSAYVILAGMAGVNGVSLPSSLESRLAPFSGNIPHLHIVFNSIFPMTEIDARGVFSSIALGLALVWLFPNVQQIMRNYKPTWEDIAGNSPYAQIPKDRISRWLSWKPSTIYACVSGILFFAVLMTLAEKKLQYFCIFNFNSMKYIATFLFGVIASAIVYYSLVLALSPAPISAEYWVREMIVVKRNIARSYAGHKKIIIASGSNSLFGIDTKFLTKELGMPVINFGLHAGLPLKTILDEAEFSAQAGDTVILPLESIYYCEDGMTEWQLRNAIAWDPKQWNDLTLVEKIRGISIMGPFFLIEQVKARLIKKFWPQLIADRLAAFNNAEILDKFSKASEPTSFAYSAYNLDSLGNMRGTKGSEYLDVPSAADSAIKICPGSWNMLSSFVKTMKQRKIGIYFANTPYVKTDHLNESMVQSTAERFNAKISQLAPVLDSKAQLVFPRNLFFNTDLHLNADGRKIRTKLLLDAILKTMHLHNE